MSSSDFFNFLVDETFKLQEAGELELSSFELKLNDYNLSYIRGEFIPQTQLLNFKTSFGTLDIPINFSVFDLNNKAPEVVIDSKTDEDLLFDVLKFAWQKDFTKMAVTHADGFCYIIGFESTEEAYLSYVLSDQELLKSA